MPYRIPHASTEAVILRRAGPLLSACAAITLTVAVSSAASSGTSGSSQTSASADQTLIFATAGLGAEGQATHTEIRAFEKVHPNIRVKVLQLASTSDNAYQQVTHYLEAGSSTPD